MTAGDRAHAGAFASGLLFAVGLAVGGMTQPGKIIGFLDVGGAWDPSLLFVMGGAVVTYAVAYRLALRRHAPWFAARFAIPTRRDVDARLVAGAALFGMGWGLGGFCPGPGIVSLAAGNLAPVLFVGAMLAGMWLVDHLSRARSTR